MSAFANCCPFHRLFTCPRRNVLRFQTLLKCRHVSHRIQCVRRAVLAAPAIYLPSFPLRLADPDHSMVGSRQQTQSYASSAVEPLLSPHVKTKIFDSAGHYTSSELKKSELAAMYQLHLRDLRFSTLTSLLVRENCFVIRLQHIKSIITSNSVTLMDTGHPVLKEFVPELQQRLAGVTSEKTTEEPLPYEFVVLDAMLTKMFTALEARCESLQLTITETLNGLLDHRLFSIDRGQLHILLQLSKDLSEFHALLLDLQGTLDDIMELEEDMAEMYLTHKDTTGESRDIEDIEEIEYLLESYYMQSEDMLRQTQQLTHLIEQSESVILINLDSQRNVMLRMSLQLEMGTFSAAVCGLLGVAFGMNLDSSLEGNVYAFWMVTGFIYITTGLLWSRLLAFLGRNLERASLFGSHIGGGGSTGSLLGIGQKSKVKRTLRNFKSAC